MRKLVLLGLGLLITLNPIKVNANQEYEEWQLELLERATYLIQPFYKNELQEINGKYYLYEEIEAFTTDWLTVSFNRSSDGYLRSNSISIPIPSLANNVIRNDISSNILMSASFDNIRYDRNDYSFTVNQTSNLNIRINDITNATAMQEYLNDNNFTIYYKLDEPRLTLLDWYDPTPTPTPDETGYTYLLIPSILIVGVLVGFIYYKRKGETT